VADHPSTSEPRRRPAFRRVAFAVPLALVAALCITYAVSPEFYQVYVLHIEQRETQIVEYITFFSALTGGLLLLWSSIRILSVGGRPWFAAAAIVGVIGLAGIFFAGEEASWGQHFFGWETPEEIREHTIETNLHNTEIPVQSLGSLFLIIMFFLLPLAWRFRRRIRLPRRWRLAVAEGPVVFCMAVAFAWKEVKRVYMFIVPEEERELSRFYLDFLEQFNEHKEMLVAVGLLMYGVYRVRAVRRWRAAGERT